MCLSVERELIRIYLQINITCMRPHTEKAKTINEAALFVTYNSDKKGSKFHKLAKTRHCYYK